MAKRAKSIDDLLAEREEFEQWLSRLDEKPDLASDKVRTKVRDDYQSRLEKVMEELGSHSDTIAEQLAEHRITQEDLTTRETSAREELAEAEVRHAVGEYDDDEWQTLKGISDEQLNQIGTELTEVSGEIERLASVQALIASSEPADAAMVPLVEDPAVVPVVSMDDEAEEEPPSMGAPKFTPRGAEVGSEPIAPRTLRFPSAGTGDSALDELDFLKSVTEDESGGPSSAAAAGQGVETGVGGTAEVATSSEGVEEGDSAGQSQAKTLKCGECGELNRPTEWYCERCGAELASL